MSVEPAGSDLHASSSRALKDAGLRANFRRAMDAVIGKQAVQFADPAEWTALRAGSTDSSGRSS